jgi:hypothetical protein
MISRVPPPVYLIFVKLSGWLVLLGWADRAILAIATCPARIPDRVADLPYHQQAQRGDGWLTGCRSRSSTC